MRRLLCFIPVLIFFSCSNNISRLQIAEKLLEEYPDSAYNMLMRMWGNDSFTEGERALYNLLMVQALDKRKLDISDDTLVEKSAVYFAAVSDSIYAAKSYFYAGKVVRNSANPSLTMAHYSRAKEFLTSEMEPKYQFLIRHYLAGAYYSYYMYEKGIKEYREAYKYAKMLNDSVYQCVTLSEIGYGFIAPVADKAMPDSTIYYEKKALELAEKLHHRRVPFILNMLSTAYYDKNQTDSALYYCNLAIKNTPVESFNLCNRKAMIFAKMNQNDSALYYSSKAFDSNVVRITVAAHQIQSEIFRKAGDYKKALEHLDPYIPYSEDNEKLFVRMYIENTDVLVKHIHIKDDHYRLYLNKEYTDKWMFIVPFVVALLFLLAGFAYYIAVSTKKKKILLQEQEIERQKTQIKMQQTEEIALRESFFRQLNVLACPVIGNIEELEKEDEDPLSKEVWDKILANANAVFNGFIDRLQKAYPSLNEKDLHYCCLVRMGLTQAEMASVFKRKKDSVKKRLKTIRTEKIDLPEDITFDQFLRNF